MDLTEPQSSHVPTSTRALKVDFSWKKWKALIMEDDAPQPEARYIVDFETMKSRMIYRSMPEDKIIGTGKLHSFSINAEYEVHGYKDTLLAQKRWQTEYTQRSQAFSDTDTPVTMTWTSTSGWKTWDFICMDENQLPVARFSANAWAIRKIGKIEFMGPKAQSDAVRDEIVVTGLTLFWCMVLRSSSILSFFGAIFASPGKLKESDK